MVRQVAAARKFAPGIRRLGQASVCHSASSRGLRRPSSKTDTFEVSALGVRGFRISKSSGLESDTSTMPVSGILVRVVPIVMTIVTSVRLR